MNPLQQASVRRKAIYFAAILGLFTLSMVWRGMIPVPLSASARPAAWLNNRTVLNQSKALDLRELEQGEPDLSGEGLRLGLVGSRGVIVAYLWSQAIENQKRNDFHKMEDQIRRVTQLQPHFITPWIFQSWNIAYNVSVEMHGSGDMYFYIARGIELLAEGERRNVKSPDMRYQIAFYYQNKFGVSDQVEVLRCLFQLSCIPPDDRNAEAGGLTLADGTVDLKKFREFCAKYPHLVRRLRGEDRQAAAPDARTQQRIQEALKCPTPKDIVEFLRVNKDVPRRYKYGAELAEADKQFPALPPQFNEGPDEAHPGMTTRDDFSAFRAARAWYAYAMTPVPPNPTDEAGRPVPAATPRPGDYDPFKYRVPRQPMLIIFRQGPPRAQTHQAEMEQKEGWFDDEGWRIDDPRSDPSQWWFPDSPGFVVGGKADGHPAWSLVEWQRAAQMWEEHGERYGLTVSPERLRNWQQQARNLSYGGLPPDPTPDQAQDPAFMQAHRAATARFFYGQNRQVTNFPYFLSSSQGEAQFVALKPDDPDVPPALLARIGTNPVPLTVLARKTLWQAEQARKLGRKFEAIALYKDGLDLWKKVLAVNPEFHRPERSDRLDEVTYEHELSYLRLLVQDSFEVRARANEVARAASAVIPFLPPPYPQTLKQTRLKAEQPVRQAAAAVVPFLPAQDPALEASDPPGNTPQWEKDREELTWHVAETYFSPFAGVMNVTDARKGGPWILPHVKESVRINQGVQRKKTGQDEKPTGTEPGSEKK